MASFVRDKEEDRVKEYTGPLDLHFQQKRHANYKQAGQNIIPVVFVFGQENETSRIVVVGLQMIYTGNVSRNRVGGGLSSGLTLSIIINVVEVRLCV